MTHLDGENTRLRRARRPSCARRSARRASRVLLPDASGTGFSRVHSRRAGREQRLAQAPDGPRHGRLRGRGAPDGALPRDARRSPTRSSQRAMPHAIAKGALVPDPGRATPRAALGVDELIDFLRAATRPARARPPVLDADGERRSRTTRGPLAGTVFNVQAPTRTSARSAWRASIAARWAPTTRSSGPSRRQAREARRPVPHGRARSARPIDERRARRDRGLLQGRARRAGARRFTHDGRRARATCTCPTQPAPMVALAVAPEEPRRRAEDRRGAAQARAPRTRPSDATRHRRRTSWSCTA